MQHILSSKERGKRLVAWLMTLVMLLFVMSSALPAAQAVTQDEINDLKSQAASLKEEQAELQSQLDKLSNSKNAALDQKFVLEEKINVLQEQIALSEQAIQDYGEMIDQKEVELAEAQAEEAKYQEEFNERVRNMEERGSVSYWSVLFNASSFSDLLDQINAISEVMDYDNEVMDNLAAARQAVADAKADLEATISEINSQSDAYSQKMHELEDDSDNVANQIAQAEKTYQAQIEAQKKAEEAKRQQQLAQQQAQQNQQNQSNSGSSGGSASTPSGGGSASSSGYLWPLSGYTRISSPFGYRICPFHGRELHGGCDIPAPGGTPIMAAKSGVVVISTYGSSYGNYVVIAHGDGSRTMYAHQSKRAVSVGQTVSQGQVIGYVGTTGSSTGNHLHFELWLNSSSSSRVNPVAYCF